MKKIKKGEEQKLAEFTGSVPICPFCKVPTERSGGGGEVTLLYFPPQYGEDGNNINPDRNTRTSHWYCCKCGKNYTISGNSFSGFRYK